MTKKGSVPPNQEDYDEEIQNIRNKLYSLGYSENHQPLGTEKRKMYKHLCKFLERLGITHITANIGTFKASKPPGSAEYEFFFLLKDKELISKKKEFILPKENSSEELQKIQDYISSFFEQSELFQLLVLWRRGINDSEIKLDVYYTRCFISPIEMQNLGRALVSKNENIVDHLEEISSLATDPEFNKRIARVMNPYEPSTTTNKPLITTNNRKTYHPQYARSYSFTPIPITKVLQLIKDYIHSNDFNPINEIQRRYLAQFYKSMEIIPENENFSLKSIVSDNEEIINNFLAENDFPEIKIPKLDPESIGAAAVMKQSVEWRNTGINVDLEGTDGKTYPAVQFEKSYRSSIFQVFKIEGYPNPILELQTKSDDKAYLSISPNINLNRSEIEIGMDLWERATNILQSERIVDPYTKVIFPKISLKNKVNMDWLLELRFIGTKYYISYADFMSKLAVNEKGAIVKAAAAARATRSMKPPQRTLIINEPFLIWFIHEGKLTYVAYIGMDDWKNPGEF